MEANQVSIQSLLIINTIAPRAEPSHNVSLADCAEAPLQKMPSKNTQVIGGAMWAIISFSPLKMLSYLFRSFY